ncbi:T9SS type B sorting domain-containing protein [Flavobacterium suzhouense]|uniref:T9SS type B sorting domain-containing protein n=1 Tax=Flavobacterium suzhouense TaxID=1529638 RepID=A0ABW5NNM6_9FLAO
MRQAHLWLCVFVLLFLNANAQQDNNWYFGRNAGLNFSTGTPEAITSSTMSTMEGSASISDNNGNILFYTDGISVWNRYNFKMPNGNGLLGDKSTTQAAVIVPKPGSQTRYYIFTADDAGGPDGLRYSEVDMQADNGKGDVVNANVLLVTPVTEKITASYHANGNDIWITTHQWGGNAFYSFKVTSAGVNTTPVISNTGLVIDGAENSGHYAGWMSISPNGKKLASASSLFAIELFDFDNTTGIVSNPVTLKTPAKCYGVEFSPNSKLLYATTDGLILQYQVNAADVSASQIQVGTIDVASSIKLAPDSKIYLVDKYLSGTLSVIKKPNVIGTGCTFLLNTIDLGGKETFVGLPNFLTSPYYLLDINTENDCTDTSVAFQAVSTLDPEEIEWDFGDGNYSTNANTTHTYSIPGTYTVKLKAKRKSLSRYYSKQISVFGTPVAGEAPDMHSCGSAEGYAAFNLAEQDSTILGNQPADQFTVTYYTSQEDAMSASNILPATYTNTLNPQTIYARISRNSGACYDITSFTLNVTPAPVLDMDDNYSFCENSYVVISAPKGFDSYTWTYNGKTESGTYQKSINKAGIYILTVSKTTGATICETTHSFTVTESQKPQILKLETTEWTDSTNSITVIMATTGNYEYSIDSNTYQDEPVFENLKPGEYTVMVRDKSGCGQDKAEAVLLMYPKFFSPNGDGIHDNWQVKYAWFTSETSITIMDRYGKIVSSFRGNSPGWDGTFNGYQLPASDYWFIITKKDGKEYKGHFSLMR